MNKAIFLDRDGVLNHDPGDYTMSLEEFHILPGVLDALKRLHDAGYLLIIITNQAGISKGLYTHDTVREIHAYFTRVCKEAGIDITAIYYSPHHEAFGKSLTRKPGSLMIERGLARYNIDAKKSWMIGDKQRDLDAAAKADVRGILIDTNAPLKEVVDSLV
ncbi:MAG: HAD-IIIA family hydrolase [Cryomorphaceae bacterium]|nr:HAD-IIIA family hydrolase [Cryomorphaceae bacterium]